MRIETRTFSDDYYMLRTKVHGKDFSITYSPKTDFDSAVNDFKEQVRVELKRINASDGSK